MFVWCVFERDGETGADNLLRLTMEEAEGMAYIDQEARLFLIEHTPQMVPIERGISIDPVRAVRLPFRMWMERKLIFDWDEEGAMLQQLNDYRPEYLQELIGNVQAEPVEVPA